MSAELLHDFWYVAAPSTALARGKTLPITLLGNALLLLRNQSGMVSALVDFCPHRGMPLRYGTFDGCEVECCYHGWRFGMDGVCTAIPSLIEGDTTDLTKIKTGNYSVIERDGLIWVHGIRASESPATEPPAMPIALPRGFAHVTSVTLPCHIDHAVIGLMDPAHGPFVHRSWWWRSRKSIHAKAKEFAPRPHGFAMVSHKPSSNSRAYKILGGDRTTEITFALPGLRCEHISIDTRHVLLLTALTPVDATTTILHQFFYTNIALARVLFPLLKLFGRAFIAQDVAIVKKQQEGLQPGHPPLLLLGDADAQARWYYRLKKEALSAHAEGRAFVNPLQARTLKWRS